MGDRANVVVKDPYGNKAEIFLYTHWGGSELPSDVQEALARKERWDDPSYLTRIVFCTMLHGDTEGETGFGISTSQPDNEYPYIVIDTEKQQVRFEREADRSVIATHSFEQASKQLKWPDSD